MWLLTTLLHLNKKLICRNNYDTKYTGFGTITINLNQDDFFNETARNINKMFTG